MRLIDPDELTQWIESRHVEDSILRVVSRSHRAPGSEPPDMPTAIHRARARLIERRELKARRTKAVDSRARSECKCCSSDRVIWNVIDLSRPVERLGDGDPLAPEPIKPLIRAALHLASRWMDEIGHPLDWMTLPEATANSMVSGDANFRAHWRCAYELVKLCEAQSGRDLPDLLRELRLEPVGQKTECPGG